MSTEVFDWKKEAAAATATNEQVEKAFFDQAYQYIENKAGPIMREPYRVGFEIVFKNDDNTRMVGIFIFRVNKRLFYAPVFFINGTIKGTDLFYDHQSRQFVLLNDRWVKYLMGMADEGEGRGVPRSHRHRSRDTLDLHRIASPPESMNRRHKSAANDGEAPPWPTKEQVIEDLCEAPATKEASEESSILKRFIQEDGSWDARYKIANAAKRDFNFAIALCQYPDDHYMPKLETQLKTASTKKAPVLKLHLGILANENIKSASEGDLAKGYVFEDHRKESAINVQIYHDQPNLETIHMPGIYNILMDDGSMRKMMVGHHLERNHVQGRHMDNNIYDHPIDQTEEPPAVAVIDLDTRSSKDGITRKQRPLGELIRYDIPDSLKNTDPQEGTTYRIYNAHDNSLSDPFYIVRISTDDLGMKRVHFCRMHRDEVESKPILINPDYDGYDYKERICGSGCYFIEIAGGPEGGESSIVRYPSDMRFGKADALNRFIFENGFKRASVRQVPSEGYQVRVKDESPFSHPMGTIGAKTYLMAKCAMNEPTADEVLAKVDGNHKVSFFYYPYLEKAGYNLSFSDWPEFEQEVNPDYGVLEQPRSFEIAEVDREEPHIERSRIGDVYQHEGLTSSSIETATPLELHQLAQESGMDSLFEHGVVGELTNTYDASDMYEKYLPDLRQALDRLGRMVFLFYWKPEDMVAAYGSDDQSQLENHLLSTFKSFGNLTLDLTLKNRSNREGSNEFS